MHKEQPNRPGYSQETNTYSSRFYYVVLTFPKYVHIFWLFPWAFLDMIKGLLRVFGGHFGTSHSSKFLFIVPDLLMNLVSLGVSQICCQVRMHFSCHSSDWHSTSVLKTSTSPYYSLINVNKLTQDSESQT